MPQKADAETKAKKDIFSTVYADMQRGMAKASYDKRFTANLRRGAGRLPEQEPDAFAAVCFNLDDELVRAGYGKITNPQKAEYFALTLFAETGLKSYNTKGAPQGEEQDKFQNESQDEEQNEKGKKKKLARSFAVAMGKLSLDKSVSENSIITTFRKILQARDEKEMLPHLFRAVKLLENKGITFDYAAFASDFLLRLFLPKYKDETVISLWENFEYGRITARQSPKNQDTE